MRSAREPAAICARRGGDSATRRFLVVVRAGEHSKHDTWLHSSRNRNWDIFVSAYSEAAPYHDLEEFRNLQIGGKWKPIHFLLVDPEFDRSRYDYFWFPDDDIEISGDDISLFFRYIEKENFDLAQPALTAGSYYSHPITLHNPLFRHRIGNFVEIMAPAMSRAFLERTVDLFQETHSGLGMEYYWAKDIDSSNGRYAIVDDIRMHHGRPLKAHLRQNLKRIAVDPEEEKALMMRRHDLKSCDAFLHQAVSKDRTVLTNRIQLAMKSAQGIWIQRKEIVKKPWGIFDYVRYFRQLVIPITCRR